MALESAVRNSGEGGSGATGTKVVDERASLRGEEIAVYVYSIEDYRCTLNVHSNRTRRRLVLERLNFRPHIGKFENQYRVFTDAPNISSVLSKLNMKGTWSL